MTPLSSLLAFLATLSLASSTPLLTGRDFKNKGNIYVTDRPVVNEPPTEFISFGDKWPTCANDKLLQGIGVSTEGQKVNTKTDCDAVINKICNAVDNVVKNSQSPNWLSHNEGSCEGHILFGHNTFGEPLNYTICVENFQRITETCMLIDDNIENHASDGQQAGVLHVYYNPQSLPHWTADTSEHFDAQMPGYMMGANGTFQGLRNPGQYIHTYDSDCIQANGTLLTGC